jgi:hypothetical protein
MFLLLFLNPPEPLARMYTRNFYRATFVQTSLTAGHLTAMNLKPAFIKHIAAVLFSLYYFIDADAADEKVNLDDTLLKYFIKGLFLIIV